MNVRAAATALLLALAAITPVQGQVVQGVVVGTDNGQPVVAATVRLVEAHSQSTIGRLTGPGGRFAITLPSAGLWTLDVEALGFRAHRQELTLAVGETLVLPIGVEVDPVGLEGLAVEVGRRCDERSGEPEVGVVWSEAHRLLSSLLDPDETRRARFRLETVERQFAGWEELTDLPEARKTFPGRQQQWDTTWVDAIAPVMSADPERLLSEGFIIPLFPDIPNAYEYEFHAPGPVVLLSEPFLNTHCFWIRQRSGMGDWTGFAFEPDRFAELEYDVEGTFWLPRTAEVRPFVEFRHTKYPRENELWSASRAARRRGGGSTWAYEARSGERVGGRIDLEYVPDLGWIVHNFEIRWPDVLRTEMIVAGAEFRERLRRGERIRDIGPRCCRLALRKLWYLTRITEFTVRVISVQLDDEGR